MNRTQRVAGWAAVGLGLLHVSITAADYPSVSLNALWFLGTGFAIVFAGFLNLVRINARSSKSFVVMANATMFALFVLTWLLLMRQPQVVAGVAVFAVLLVTSLFHVAAPEKRSTRGRRAEGA